MGSEGMSLEGSGRVGVVVRVHMFICMEYLGTSTQAQARTSTQSVSGTQAGRQALALLMNRI